MDSYEEMIIPEVPKALPNEQLFIYVPIASDDTAGVAKFDNEYFSVDADGTVHLRSLGKSGIITIPVSEWSDAAPTVATAGVSGVDFRSIILMLPADEQTRLTANKAKLSAYPTMFTPVLGSSSITIFRAEAENIPDSDMTFAYVILKAEFSFSTPIAAIIGIDAYDEGGGVGGLTQAETETIVKKIVPSWARRNDPPEESDPTVPDWAKGPTKPTYNKNEVGLSNVDNVRQYSADNPPPYPVTSVNGKTGAVSLFIPSEASHVKADPEGTASTMLMTHNVDTTSHPDFRVELQRLADRLNAALNSTDTSLDDLKEIVAYIKSNKTLIDGITSSKVNVTDIVNNLTTNTANVPLSAAQGVALKLLIDSLEKIVEGKVSAEQVSADITAALKDYITASKATELYQPKGNYLTQNDLPTIPTALPNPKALTILGKTYTGADAVSITVDDLIAALPDGSEVEY